MNRRELERLERRLLRERDRARRALRRFEEEVRTSQEWADGGYSPYHDQLANHATDAMEREQTVLLANKEGRYLYRIEDALRRLYQGPEEFGKCQSCGLEIPFDRLEALPHARYCLECKLREEEAL